MNISIVVATLNRASRLSITLASLAALTVPDGFELELIVVDNGSDDDTARVLADFRPPFRFRAVVEPARGLAIARNTGVEMCAGEIVLITDDDIQADPKWPSSMAEAVTLHG